MYIEILKNVDIADGNGLNKFNYLMVFKKNFRFFKNTLFLMIPLFLIISCSQNKKIISFNEKALKKRDILKLESDYYVYYNQKRFTEASQDQYENVMFMKGFKISDLRFYASFGFKLRRGLSSKELLAKRDPLQIARFNTPEGVEERYYFGFILDDEKHFTGVVDLLNGKVESWADIHGRYPDKKQRE